MKGVRTSNQHRKFPWRGQVAHVAHDLVGGENAVVRQASSLRCRKRNGRRRRVPRCDREKFLWAPNPIVGSVFTFLERELGDGEAHDAFETFHLGSLQGGRLL